MPANQMFIEVKADDKEGRALAFQQMYDSVARTEPIVRGAASNIYNNISPGGVSVRDGFNRGDYDSFRWDESSPRRVRGQIAACMREYENEGIVFNGVGLMSDFACRGIDLACADEDEQKWWRAWAKKIKIKDRSEHFLSDLFLTAQTIVQRQTGKITVKVRNDMMRTAAAPDLEAGYLPEVTLETREIPLAYSFLNPLSLHVIAEEVATFVAPEFFQFALELPQNVVNAIKNPSKMSLGVIEGVPRTIRDKVVKQGLTTIPLDQDKVTAFYYKKKDWRVWATPMIAPILKHLRLFEKMQLADLAALDGAISCIRVWKLGDLEKGLFPTDAAISRLAQMLQNNVGGGVMDLIWGPAIDLLETKTEVHKFLGDAKYAPVLRFIYQGLGIPSAAGGKGEGGFNQDFFSLKTLTDRLEYGRDKLREFWVREIELVRKSMGFETSPTLVFAYESLTDQAAQKKLWMDLADRNFLSWETLLERFGEDPEVEAGRLAREFRKRKAGDLPPKGGPWYDPQADLTKQKLFITSGSVTPSQVGLDLPKPKDGELTPAEHTAKVAPKPKLAKPAGRPLNSRDQSGRKKRSVLPRSSAAATAAKLWADRVQAQVQGLTGPVYLKSLGKANFRELTVAEAADYEDFRFRVAAQFGLNEEVTEGALKRALAGGLLIPKVITELVRATADRHREVTGREVTANERREIQSMVLALYHAEIDEEPQTPEQGRPVGDET